MSDHWSPDDDRDLYRPVPAPLPPRNPDLDLAFMAMGAIGGVMGTLFALWCMGVLHAPALRLGCA